MKPPVIFRLPFVEVADPSTVPIDVVHVKEPADIVPPALLNTNGVTEKVSSAIVAVLNKMHKNKLQFIFPKIRSCLK